MQDSILRAEDARGDAGRIASNTAVDFGKHLRESPTGFANLLRLFVSQCILFLTGLSGKVGAKNGMIASPSHGISSGDVQIVGT